MDQFAAKQDLHIEKKVFVEDSQVVGEKSKGIPVYMALEGDRCRCRSRVF
jgi:hypothetical protein